MMLLDVNKRGLLIVRQHDQVACVRLRNAGRDRGALPRSRCIGGVTEEGIKVAVVRAVEDDHTRPPRVQPAEPEREGGRFGAGGHERASLHAGESTELLGVARSKGMGPAHSPLPASHHADDRVAHKRWVVPKGDGAEAATLVEQPVGGVDHVAAAGARGRPTIGWHASLYGRQKLAMLRLSLSLRRAPSTYALERVFEAW